MKILRNFFDANAYFRSNNAIRQSITRSKNYAQEDPASARILRIFSTSKQRTYLISTPKRMYCILDDTRKPKPHINWSMPRKELERDGKVIIPLSTSDKTEKTGYVDIGPKHKGWLFTKALFEKKSIIESIKSLIQESRESS